MGIRCKIKKYTILIAKIVVWFKKRNHKNKVSVLVFHNVNEDAFIDFSTNLSKIFEIIDNNEFEEFQNKLVEGGDKLRVYFTFDDGYVQDFKVCNNYGGHIFLVSDFLDQSENPEERLRVKNVSLTNLQLLKEIVPNFDKIKIGSHSKSHISLGGNERKVLEREIIQSKYELTNYFKVSINSFAFPFGGPRNMSKMAIKIAKQNYKSVYSTLPGQCRKGDKIIPRYDILPMITTENILTIQGGYDWLYVDKWILYYFKCVWF